MCSRCLSFATACLLLIATAIAVACERREYRPSAIDRYQESSYALNEGRRLYTWFNCEGCHFLGGGGIGPALMDDAWIYGADPEAVFTTIVEGRPNGMPSFRNKIPESQVWPIVAYVRSMSGQAAKTMVPGRLDHMSAKPAAAGQVLGSR